MSLDKYKGNVNTFYLKIESKNGKFTKKEVENIIKKVKESNAKTELFTSAYIAWLNEEAVEIIESESLQNPYFVDKGETLEEILAKNKSKLIEEMLAIDYTFDNVSDTVIKYLEREGYIKNDKLE